MYDGRPTFAEIDLFALKHNYELIRSKIPPGTEIMAVVKADAYGHGFMNICSELETLGVNSFGVAFLAEGIQLRKSGIDKPILILGGLYPGQERTCIGYNISTTVFTLEQAKAINHAASIDRQFRRAQLHLKVDTGMGRLGVPYNEVPFFLVELRKLEHVVLEGVFSHFASADELDESGQNFTRQQSERFAWTVAETRMAGFTPRYIHIANSAAAILCDVTGSNLIRPGITLYGALLSANFQEKLDFKPVMHLKSRIATLKWVENGTTISYARRFTAAGRTLIATVPIGYADGYPRQLSNKGEVLVRGERAKVAGTVCMDWIMVDVTGIKGVSVGDTVTLMGIDEKGGCIHAEELAALADTIPYTIFCGISKRVPRIYKKSIAMTKEAIGSIVYGS